jgi:thiol-disulfide isomerase/thioredoxin
MKFILFALIMTIGITSYAQKDFDISTDTEDNSTVYKGKINFGDLEKETGFDWLGHKENYKPDAAQISYLQQHLPQYHLIVFMGTWCSDSKSLLPMLHAVLTQAKYPVQRLTMYGVDRAKTAKNGEEKTYAIKFVPTIILMKDNKEAGRIVESVQTSMEADMVDIIKGDLDD